jgi:outer membrane protein OmpA-like peptidoglycan-associated protein
MAHQAVHTLAAGPRFPCSRIVSMSDFRSALVLATALAALAGCRTPGGRIEPEALPERDQGLSFSGDGSERIDRRRFEPVIFRSGSWVIEESERAKIAAIAAELGSGRRALLAGVGDEGRPDEYNRVLGEARAQTVRKSLVATGVAPTRLQTVSYGSEWPDRENDRELSRVVVGLIKPGNRE